MLKFIPTSLSILVFFVSASLNLNGENRNGIIYFYGYPFNTEAEIRQIAQNPGVLKGEISIEWKDVFIDRNQFDWTYIDKNIEIWRKQNKKVILRFMTANNSTYCTSPKLINDERIRLISEGFFTDFENDPKNDGYEIVNGIIGMQNLSEAGFKSLELNDNKSAKLNLIKTGHGVKLSPNASYLVQFDFKIADIIRKRKDAKFNIILHSSSTDNTIVESFTVKNGESGLLTKEIASDSGTDFKLIVEAENIASCALDNINIIQSSDSRGRRVAFPNYFSQTFKSAYERFMKEAAIKYADNPNVDAININGIGRWEEMLLNANEEGVFDVQQSIYRQWRAYGYTDVNYLKKVVGWSIDISKKYFPVKEHILQISPMNNGYENEDFIYRRAAAMAIAKGVSIKQNGMSEKYDTWAPTSDPAYVMNRYRHLTIPYRYYETAGQIFRNTLKAMGHPVSLFNRVAIDGVNYLYLYKADIFEPNVQKYFPYFDSIIQNPLFSKLYTRLGEFPLANQKKQNPNLLDTIMYHNNWLGIRQYEDNETNVDYVVHEKSNQKGVKTSKFNSKILFDVDDRVMYNGMSNPVLTIEYLDEGTDFFNVYILDRRTNMIRKAEEVKKSNSGRFLLKSIPLGNSFDAYDNHREVRPEIVIDDNKDGCEFISSMEIDFVPLNQLQMELVAECKSTGKSLILKDSADVIRRAVPLSVSKPVARAEVSFCDQDFDHKTDIYTSLHLVHQGKSVEVSRKQYYIGGDKELIPMPVATCLIADSVCISVFRGKGKVGVYADTKGEMAYKIYCFKNSKNSDLAYRSDGCFEIMDFFNGIEFPSNNEARNYVLIKILPDQSEQIIESSLLENYMYFQPQSKGCYKLLQNTKIVKPVSVMGLLSDR